MDVLRDCDLLETYPPSDPALVVALMTLASDLDHRNTPLSFFTS